jgi:Tol biopolymer transport system component
MWQIVRHDLRSGDQDPITQAPGSALRPRLSPDGRSLVYGTRHEQQTGLRIRNLDTGSDRWLIHPVTRDEQESRFTRDLLPGYAFTPDGRALLLPRNGGIVRVDVATGEATPIPFRVLVDKGIGADLEAPYRLGLGPVKARLIRDPALSPDGRRLAFSAFNRIYLHDLASGESRALSPEAIAAFHPAWSPDGRTLVYASWDTGGGHLWRQRADGRGRPQRLTDVAGYYSDPAFAPDGERVVALRASSYERLSREFDLGVPVGSDVIWLPADGGVARLVMPSRGFAGPHFGPEADRIYLYQGTSNGGGLVSVRFDGSDRRHHVTAKGPGLYLNEDAVAADDVRLSPDGRHALISHANQLYLAALLNPNLQGIEIGLDKSPVPLARLTDVGADFFGWDGASGVFWSAGHAVYRRGVTSVAFRDEAGDGDDAADDDGSEGDDPPADGRDDEPLREGHEAVSLTEIAVYLPRAVPEGVVVLEGATVLPMTDRETVIADAVVVVENDRIAAVGRRGEVRCQPAPSAWTSAVRSSCPGSSIPTPTSGRCGGCSIPTTGRSWPIWPTASPPPRRADQHHRRAGVSGSHRRRSDARAPGPVHGPRDLQQQRLPVAAARPRRAHPLPRPLRRAQSQGVSGGQPQAAPVDRRGGPRARHDAHHRRRAGHEARLTHAIDGFWGNEHNFPLTALYRDVVELVARSGMTYTPTLLVNYGGPFAESYFYTRESPHRDAKLRRFTPGHLLAARTLRGPWFHEDEYVFTDARRTGSEDRPRRRSGRGRRPRPAAGLGYHWELWALASGMSNWEALTAATRHGAEIIGVAADIGTVEAGKLADLVVLDADPLIDIRHSNAHSLRHEERRALRCRHPGPDLAGAPRPLPPQWWWDLDPPAPDQPASP